MKLISPAMVAGRERAIGNAGALYYARLDPWLPYIGVAANYRRENRYA